MRYQKIEKYLDKIDSLTLVEKVELLTKEPRVKYRMILLTAIASHAQMAIQANIEELD